MNMNYTFIIRKQGDCWVGWVEQIPGIHCQEQTHKKLIDLLEKTLIGYMTGDITDLLGNYEQVHISYDPSKEKVFHRCQ